MIVQLTRDRRGVAIWPEMAKLKLISGRWYDENCVIRGQDMPYNTADVLLSEQPHLASAFDILDHPIRKVIRLKVERIS